MDGAQVPSWVAKDSGGRTTGSAGSEAKGGTSSVASVWALPSWAMGSGGDGGGGRGGFPERFTIDSFETF